MKGLPSNFIKRYTEQHKPSEQESGKQTDNMSTVLETADEDEGNSSPIHFNRSNSLRAKLRKHFNKKN